jgi:hypothetical protein
LEFPFLPDDPLTNTHREKSCSLEDQFFKDTIKLPEVPDVAISRERCQLVALTAPAA